MTDSVPTIRERLLNAGIPPEVTDNYLAAGVVRVNGHPTTDPTTPCGPEDTYAIGPTS